MQAEEQNGLKRGVYFQSQAVTVEEAQEEAQLVIDYVSEMQITYPIAISLGLVANDSSRIDAIPKKELTEITNAFCAMIKEAGYTPAVYGNKYWLLRKIDLTQLGDYDIWLSQDGEIPDYPYQFTMWQYAQSANISGITGEARLNISFVDYSQR
jgi:GH25 family lysozyme M1 (1,4-beta-N-acetylmuramidase)